MEFFFHKNDQGVNSDTNSHQICVQGCTSESGIRCKVAQSFNECKQRQKTISFC